MKSFASIASVFVIASIVSVKCLSAEETNAILREVQKDILNLAADMVNIKRQMLQDRQDRDQLTLKLNQTMSLYQENHYVKQELKVMQDELKKLKAKDLQIRLVQNDSIHASEGRLEIFYDGEWGTVCDDLWDDNDATVVCRMLGFSYGKATIKATFGQGSGRILLDEVQCDGHESTLDNCQFAWRRHDCNHEEDSGVICKPLTSQEASIFQNRFEILHDGIWGTVCDDLWDDTEATVACRMLDYRYGYTHKPRAGNKTIWLDDVNCTGKEESIKDCEHMGWGIHNCKSNEDVGILCRNLASRDLRLKGGNLANKGRLEIFHLGHWGTVCDDGWDDQDATVACRMLGFTYGKATIAATFGQGSGRIWLDEVRCKGTETNLEDCHHGGWGRENCFHHEDAGVVCQ